MSLIRFPDAMAPLAEPKPMALLDENGAIVPLGTSPVSADEAAERLPLIQRFIREARRTEKFLLDVIGSAFVPGQTEKRMGDQLFEAKRESTWEVTDAEALLLILDVARERGDITDEERGKAAQTLVTHKFNHSALNVLAKRIPDIDKYRQRVEGPISVRIKA